MTSEDAEGLLHAGASYRVLKSVKEELDDDRISDLGMRMKDATRHFPSLAGETVTLAKVMPETEYVRGRPVAAADSHNKIVYVRTEERTSNVTIFHELGHLALRKRNSEGEDHPLTSEPYCSIWSTSQMPPRKVDTDSLPYLGEPDTDPEDWPGICERALDYRERRGENSHYIQKCKEWLGI